MVDKVVQPLYYILVSCQILCHPSEKYCQNETHCICTRAREDYIHVTADHIQIILVPYSHASINQLQSPLVLNAFDDVFEYMTLSVFTFWLQIKRKIKLKFFWLQKLYGHNWNLSGEYISGYILSSSFPILTKYTKTKTDTIPGASHSNPHFKKKIKNLKNIFLWQFYHW